MKICAIVPIKHESTRVPGKNYRLMNGKPLYFYILETLQKSARFFSNCFVRGPVVIQPDFKAAVTSAMIFSSIRGGEKGIISIQSGKSN